MNSADDDWLEEHIAREVSLTAEFAEIAARVEAAVKAEAAKDSSSGGFARSIKTKEIRTRKGIRDYLVFSDHPDALAIEYGHLAGKKDRTGRTFVPGKHAFTNGAKKAGRS